jgi:hypothetical protein
MHSELEITYEATMANHETEVDVDDRSERSALSAVGDHPVSTGLGAAAGGVAAGALAGSVVGPVGTVLGAIAGAVVGGFAGKGIGEMIDPAAEDAYWQENYSDRPYVASGSSYEDYGPAYRYGAENFGRFEGGSFEHAEPVLERDWENAKGTSTLTWDKARSATRDSWQRIGDTFERAIPGDSDHDGK